MIQKLRKRLDEVCKLAAAADPEGSEIEHLNHEVLVAARDLGTALNRRDLMTERVRAALIRELSE